MNFLKTIFAKYDLAVNSEKLSKKPLTQIIFYDIITLGGASVCLSFLFFCVLVFPIRITATNIYDIIISLVHFEIFCQGRLFYSLLVINPMRSPNTL